MADALARIGAPLPDTAALRAHPCTPALDPSAWEALAADLRRCAARLTAQGRLDAFACELLADGHLVLLAWTAATPLSGCSHDALTAVLAAHERDGQRLLAAPPLIVGTTPVCVVDRGGLRALLQAGRIHDHTPVWDPHQQDLGHFRRRGCVPLAEHPVGALLRGRPRAP